MSKRANSFEEIRTLLAGLPGPDNAAVASIREREPSLTKPPGSLGRLEDITEWLAAWQGKHPPSAERPRVLVFAGNHGIAAQGVSAYPPEVTAQMVLNFEHGGAAINQLCKAQDAELEVLDVGVEAGTEDFSYTPAMSEADCVTAIQRGMDAVRDGNDLICIGEMGIGNTTSAAAICHAVYGGTAADWVGPGTGVEGDALSTKTKVVQDSVALHNPAMDDGLDILRHLGGKELAAMYGAILAARLARQPVVLDGYVAGAAAAALEATQGGALDHCLAGHVSAEPGHVRLLEKLDKAPLLDLGMRLGESSGAAVAIGLIKCAVACHTGMATFAEAGVTDKD